MNAQNPDRFSHLRHERNRMWFNKLNPFLKLGYVAVPLLWFFHLDLARSQHLLLGLQLQRRTGRRPLPQPVLQFADTNKGAHAYNARRGQACNAPQYPPAFRLIRTANNPQQNFKLEVSAKFGKSNKTSDFRAPREYLSPRKDEK